MRISGTPTGNLRWPRLMTSTMSAYGCRCPRPFYAMNPCVVATFCSRPQASWTLERCAASEDSGRDRQSWTWNVDGSVNVLVCASSVIHRGDSVLNGNLVWVGFRSRAQDGSRKRSLRSDEVELLQARSFEQARRKTAHSQIRGYFKSNTCVPCMACFSGTLAPTAKPAEESPQHHQQIRVCEAALPSNVPCTVHEPKLKKAKPIRLSCKPCDLFMLELQALLWASHAAHRNLDVRQVRPSGGSLPVCQNRSMASVQSFMWASCCSSCPPPCQMINTPSGKDSRI